jgi:hypothetical protein
MRRSVLRDDFRQQMAGALRTACGPAPNQLNLRVLRRRTHSTLSTTGLLRRRSMAGHGASPLISAFSNNSSAGTGETGAWTTRRRAVNSNGGSPFGGETTTGWVGLYGCVDSPHRVGALRGAGWASREHPFPYVAPQQTQYAATVDVGADWLLVAQYQLSTAVLGKVQYNPGDPVDLHSCGSLEFYDKVGPGAPQGQWGPTVPRPTIHVVPQPMLIVLGCAGVRQPYCQEGEAA